METIIDFITTIVYRLLIVALMGAGAAALTYAANWLRHKADETKKNTLRDFSESQRWQLNAAIEVFVKAAQQSLSLDKRFLYVKGLALQAAQSLHIEITDAQLNALIESAVLELKQSLKE